MFNCFYPARSYRAESGKKIIRNTIYQFFVPHFQALRAMNIVNTVHCRPHQIKQIINQSGYAIYVSDTLRWNCIFYKSRNTYKNTPHFVCTVNSWYRTALSKSIRILTFSNANFKIFKCNWEPLLWRQNHSSGHVNQLPYLNLRPSYFHCADLGALSYSAWLTEPKANFGHNCANI